MTVKVILILLVLLLTVEESSGFRGEVVVQVTPGSSLLSVGTLRLTSATSNQTSSTTSDLESSTTQVSEKEQSEAEEDSDDTDEEVEHATQPLKEGSVTDVSWITYSKWNRSHSASSYHKFQTKLLKERPLGGFNVAWGRGNGSRKASLFSMPNQNLNVIPNNDSITANAEAAAIAILEGAKTSLTSAIPSTSFSDQASAIFHMCRPKNLPACVLIHVVALRSIQNAVASDSSLQGLFFRPGILATLAALLLITSVSMLLNDYYDSKSGVDLENNNGTNGEEKPLVTGVISRAVVRQVITLLCIAIITCTFSVPSNVAKFGIVASGVAVYYYTEYIKPITWVKNICCATLIAASPVVSAFAAFCQILRDSPKSVTLTATSLYPIARMVVSMFSWCMSREIVMDIRDYYGDKKMCLETVPVKHGKRFASKAALIFAALFAVSAISGPLYSLMYILPSTPSAWLYARLALATFGSLSMLWRMFSVYKCEGDDKEVCRTAVDSSLISGVLLLLSVI